MTNWFAAFRADPEVIGIGYGIYTAFPAHHRVNMSAILVGSLQSSKAFVVDDI
ncbi:MAG: hypothetical protein ACREOZ_01225 [Gloeomargaritales cyanobacterium]